LQRPVSGRARAGGGLRASSSACFFGVARAGVEAGADALDLRRVAAVGRLTRRWIPLKQTLDLIVQVRRRHVCLQQRLWMRRGFRAPIAVEFVHLAPPVTDPHCKVVKTASAVLARHSKALVPCSWAQLQNCPHHLLLDVGAGAKVSSPEAYGPCLPSCSPPASIKGELESAVRMDRGLPHLHSGESDRCVSSTVECVSHIHRLRLADTICHMHRDACCFPHN
jgi:hypothetical protein